MTLYLGLEVPESLIDKVIHYPVIKIAPRKLSFDDYTAYTHYIFTSKIAVRVLLEHFNYLKLDLTLLKKSCLIAVGKRTAYELHTHGLPVSLIAENECAEGIVELLEKEKLNDPYFFWGHSNLSRDILPQYFKEKKLKYNDCILYDNLCQKPSFEINLTEIKEIIFTSPSTVQGFLNIFRQIPKHVKVTAIGPVTLSFLKSTQH